METLAELIAQYGITAEVVHNGPTKLDGWPCNTYTVTLRREGRGDGDHENNPASNWARIDGLETTYYQGTGVTAEPTALDVLACLLTDSEGYDNSTYFEDWADEYGYDPDSHKAEALYEEIGEQRKALYDFLSDGYDGRYSHYDRFIEAERALRRSRPHQAYRPIRRHRNRNGAHDWPTPHL